MTHYSSKDHNTVLIVIATAILLSALAFQFSSFNSGSYSVNKNDLFKIDSVRMLSRAFMLTGKNSRGIEFEDEKRKTFIITGSRYDAITDESKLYDTLQYSALIMTVFTNKTGLDNYCSKDNTDKIEVYNIQVGETYFINLNNINKNEHDNRKSTIVFLLAAYCVALVYYFRQRMKNNNTS